MKIDAHAINIKRFLDDCPSPSEKERIKAAAILRKCKGKPIRKLTAKDFVNGKLTRG